MLQTSTSTEVVVLEEGRPQRVALTGLSDLKERHLEKLDEDELAEEANHVIAEFNAVAGIVMEAGWPRILYLGRIWIVAKERNKRKWGKWFKANIKGRSMRSAQDDMRIVDAVENGKFDPKSADSAELPVGKALKLLAKPKRGRGGGGSGLTEAEAQAKAMCAAYDKGGKEGRELFHAHLRKQHGLCVVPAHKMPKPAAATAEDEEAA